MFMSTVSLSSSSHGVVAIRENVWVDTQCLVFFFLRAEVFGLGSNLSELWA